MDLDTLGGIRVIGLIILMIFVIIIEIVAVVFVAGAIASFLGLSGVLWWAVAIVLFLLINGILSRLL